MTEQVKLPLILSAKHGGMLGVFVHFKKFDNCPSVVKMPLTLTKAAQVSANWW